jgi:hypothetical protein
MLIEFAPCYPDGHIDIRRAADRSTMQINKRTQRRAGPWLKKKK